MRANPRPTLRSRAARRFQYGHTTSVTLHAVSGVPRLLDKRPQAAACRARRRPPQRYGGSIAEARRDCQPESPRRSQICQCREDKEPGVMVRAPGATPGARWRVRRVMRVVPGRRALSAAAIPGIASAAGRSFPCPGASGVPRHEACPRSRPAQRDQDVNVHRGHQGYRRVDAECDLLAVPHSQSGRPCLDRTLLLGERMGHHGGLGELAGADSSRGVRGLGRRAGICGSRRRSALRNTTSAERFRRSQDVGGYRLPGLDDALGCFGQSVWFGQIRVAVIAMPRFVVPYCWISASSSRIR